MEELLKNRPIYKSKKIIFALGGFEVLNFFHSKLVGNAFEENNL